MRRQAEQNGIELPGHLLNEPELRIDGHFYYHAFWQLTSDRPVGFGPAPIPGSAIRVFARDYELNDEESADLEFMIRRMDGKYLELQQEFEKHEAKRQAAKQHQEGKQPKGRGRT